MADYEKLLEQAYKKLPDLSKDKGRFEIPKLASGVIGNRTIIKNLVPAAKHLDRDSQQLLKYISKELATSGHISGNTAEFIGKFGRVQIDQKFDRYVKDYVLCKGCGKPDTTLVKEGRQMFLKCNACGARRSVDKI